MGHLLNVLAASLYLGPPAGTVLKVKLFERGFKPRVAESASRSVS
jgi:hypothetical protein